VHTLSFLLRGGKRRTKSRPRRFSHPGHRLTRRLPPIRSDPFFTRVTFARAGASDWLPPGHPRAASRARVGWERDPAGPVHAERGARAANNPFRLCRCRSSLPTQEHRSRLPHQARAPGVVRWMRRPARRAVRVDRDAARAGRPDFSCWPGSDPCCITRCVRVGRRNGISEYVRGAGLVLVRVPAGRPGGRAGQLS